MNILIIEKQNLIREALKLYVRRKYQDALVSGVATLQEALPSVKELGEDIIVIIGLDSHVADGTETGMSLLAAQPGCKVVALSMLDRKDIIADTFNAGFTGFLNRKIGDAEFHFALEHIQNGGRFLSSELGIAFIQRYVNKKQEIAGITVNESEIEVLKLLAQGYTSIESAVFLKTSVRTVENIRQSLIERSGSKNVASLVYYAMSKNLIR